MLDDVSKLPFRDTITIHDNALGEASDESSGADAGAKEREVEADLRQHAGLVLNLSFISDEIAQYGLLKESNTTE